MQLGKLAAELGLQLEGDPTLELHGVAPLETAGPGELSFVRSERFLEAAPGLFPEVYVKADLATCEERDPKGLYK